MQDNTSSSVLFDIPQLPGGVNESEKILAKLSQKSYLSLWSFSNLYTDEDLRDGKGSGKELCDVLVVFGDDVVIFSDKHIQFQEDKPMDVAWPRWYKRAVAGSVSQLFGAMNWLKRFPKRAFLDAKCTRPLPVKVPPADRARYHLVAVTRGSLNACQKYFNGGHGTPMINMEIKGDDHLKHPFQIGFPTPNKHFIHVVDEVSLELLHQELDTVADFVEYLSEREAFLGNPATVVMAEGEEQLLAAYLMYMNGDKHSFLPEKMMQEPLPDSVNFDGSFFENLKKNPNYLAKKEADKPSYFWDSLVEKFIQLGDPGLVRPELNQLPSHLEEGLRFIAAESRFKRRILTSAISSLLQLARTYPGTRRTRIVVGDSATMPVYIFLAFAKPQEVSYEQYRRVRAHFLEAYCRCAKLKFPESNTFIGIAFDHPVKDYAGASEDLAVHQIDTLSAGDKAELEKVRDELGILADDMSMQNFHATEYPQLKSRHYPPPTNEKSAGKNQKKARKKIAKASRKRNRK